LLSIVWETQGAGGNGSTISAVQILIYVMLGWGLNIVVGLAGLLDLGYMSRFYAVGAYSYALLAHNFGLSFLDFCCPVRGLLGRVSGASLLGFPVVAALAWRLSCHRHARLRRDYPADS